MGNKSYFRYFALKTLFQALYLEIKPLKFTLAAYLRENLKWQLLKKLSIEFYETQDLST